jgi:hypothetical protein
LGRHRQFAIGLTLLIGGLTVIAFGTAYPAADPVAALGYLIVVPSLVSCCGTVLIAVGLARRIGGRTRSTSPHRIVGISAMSGLGLALASGTLGILSQVPDSLAGLNGAYVAGPAPAIEALVLGGIGLSVGLVIGTVASFAWWAYRGRHLPRQS